MYFLSLALFALNVFILDGLGGYVLNKRHFSDLLFVSVDERICIFGDFYDVIWLNLIFHIINILISELSSNFTLYVDFSLQEDSILDDLAILFLPVFIKILSCSQGPEWYSQSKGLEWDKRCIFPFLSPGLMV